MIAGAVLDCGNFNLTPITPPITPDPDYPNDVGVGVRSESGAIDWKKI